MELSIVLIGPTKWRKPNSWFDSLVEITTSSQHLSNDYDDVAIEATLYLGYDALENIPVSSGEDETGSEEEVEQWCEMAEDDNGQSFYIRESPILLWLVQWIWLQGWIRIPSLYSAWFGIRAKIRQTGENAYWSKIVETPVLLWTRSTSIVL